MFYFSGFWFNNSIWLHWQVVNSRISCHKKRKGICQKLLLSSLHIVSVKACVCWTGVTKVSFNNSVCCSVEVWLLTIELSLCPGHWIKEMKVRRRTEDEVCSSVVEREEPGKTVPEVSMEGSVDSVIMFGHDVMWTLVSVTHTEIPPQMKNFPVTFVSHNFLPLLLP